MMIGYGKPLCDCYRSTDPYICMCMILCFSLGVVSDGGVRKLPSANTDSVPLDSDLKELGLRELLGIL